MNGQFFLYIHFCVLNDFTANVCLSKRMNEQKKICRLKVRVREIERERHSEKNEFCKV